MSILNFSAFAKAVQSGTANMEPTNVVRLILDSVTSCDNTTNAAKDVYFQPKYLAALTAQVSEIFSLLYQVLSNKPIHHLI